MKIFFVFALLISMLTVSACSSKSEDVKPAQQTETTTTKETTKNESKNSSVPTATPTTDTKSTETPKTTTTSDKLEGKKVLSDKVEILIPKGFEVMSEEMAKTKYPNENRPKLIYTNEDGSVNIAFNPTATPVEDNQIAQVKDELKKVFKNVYPEATWYKDEVTEINGKNVGVFELLTPAIDTKIYNLIFFCELDGKLLMTTVNCKEDQMTEWQPLAQEILQSFKVN